MRDGCVDLFILTVHCRHCRVISLHLPWHESQELHCALCGHMLGLVDACLTTQP